MAPVMGSVKRAAHATREGESAKLEERAPVLVAEDQNGMPGKSTEKKMEDHPSTLALKTRLP